jgi:Rrf2 family protein
MKLSKTSAQAALALGVLASQPDGEYLQARHIAEKLNIPTVSALKILQALTRGHLIESQLGRSGGYRLACPAHEVSLLKIVEAIDGPVRGQMRIDGAPAGVAQGVERLRAACTSAADALRDQLERTTVADLATAA